MCDDQDWQIRIAPRWLLPGTNLEIGISVVILALKNTGEENIPAKQTIPMHMIAASFVVKGDLVQFFLYELAY